MADSQPPAADAGPLPATPLELDEAEAAFELGDWRSARALARRELSSPDVERRLAAGEMLARFAADPWLVAVYFAALAIFLAVAVRYLLP